MVRGNRSSMPPATRITPGNFLHTGGVIRQKPDFTAADGVGTTLDPASGLNPFYGTSAAAPHAGAIAALVKQAAPLATNAQIATFLTSTALDIMAPGSDAGSGVGILQAFQAVSAAKGGVGLPVFDPGTITVTRVPAPGPVLPGDSATMLVQIINDGAATGTAISAVLTTSTPCITISGNSSAYPDTAVGAGNTNTTPFAFSLSGACVCPTTIDFTLTVTFAGGTSIINFSYVTGPPPVVINGNLNSTPVVPSGYGFSSAIQTTRLSRNGVAGTCAAPIAFPGLAGGAANRRVDAYTFTTGSLSPSYCISVQLDNLSGVELQSTGYGGVFDPTNLATNYKADAGTSALTINYSFTAAANTLVTITVNEVVTNAGSEPYKLTIGGLCGVQPDLAITKTAPPAVLAGSNLTYNLSVTNTGGDATNVSLTDTLPPGTTFVSFTSPAGWVNTTPPVGGTGTVTSTNGVLAGGATANFTLVVAVDASVANGTVLANTATIATPLTEASLANNASTAVTVVINAADVAILKTGPATVVPGTDVTYNITVANIGPNDAQNVSVIDPPPAATSFVSLVQNTGPALPGTMPAGSVATLTLVLHVNPATPPGTVITNTANVTTTTVDPNLANNASSVVSTVSSADLAVTKVAPAIATAGNNVTYSISVQNIGAADAANVVLSDVLPPGTTFVSFTSPGGWGNVTPPVGSTGAVTSSIALLTAGATANFTLVVHVASSVANGTAVSNTATAITTSTDPNPANNSATGTTVIIALADVTITKIGSPNVSPGGNLTYNIAVTNTGPSDAQAMAMVDSLPAGTTFVSETQNTGPAFGCVNPAVGANGTVTCAIASMAAGSTATFTIVVQVSGSAAIGSVISNTATLAFADPGPGTTGISSAGSVVALAGGGSPQVIPTLNEWMLALLALLLVGSAGYVAARRRG